MRLHRPGAEVFVPDGLPAMAAIGRTTHMGVVAHPDDLEIMAWPAIRDCFGHEERWFLGVVATGGAGSARSGPHAALTDDEMLALRLREQKKAAVIGEYAAVVLLDYSSADVKSPDRTALVGDVTSVLRIARPSVVYTHNLADRHSTHVGLALATIEACRALPAEERPARVLGGEVWRDLDWLTDGDKVAEDAAGRENLAAALIGVFDSQIAGGKRHDLAVIGRRRAHATYHDSHHVDATSALSLAMDLTPLLRDVSVDPAAYAQGLVDRFAGRRARSDRGGSPGSDEPRGRRPRLADGGRGPRRRRAAAGRGRLPVRVSAGEETILTYEEGPPDLNPPFDLFTSGRFNYPYTLRENLTDRRAPRVWRTLNLENEHLRVTVLPDLGGRLWRCIDKANGRVDVLREPLAEVRPGGVPRGLGDLRHRVQLPGLPQLGDLVARRLRDRDRRGRQRVDRGGQHRPRLRHAVAGGAAPAARARRARAGHDPLQPQRPAPSVLLVDERGGRGLGRLAAHLPDGVHREPRIHPGGHLAGVARTGST